MKLDLGQYTGQVEKLGFKIYTPTLENDVLFLRLWIKLSETGEIHKLLNPAQHTLFGFMALFQPPVTTIFTLNSQNQINYLTWFTEFSCATPSVFTGLWVDRSQRGSRNMLLKQKLVHIGLFQNISLIYAVTRQQNIDRFRKCGYNLVGQMPGFYVDELGFMLAATKESFESSRLFSIV
jgi:hypothetical protein